MKKLMIAVVIVCAAAVSHAAAFNWKTAKTGGAVNAFEGGSIVASTAYIFTSDKAATILSAFAAGNDWTSGALDTSSIATTGKIAVKEETFDYGGAGVAATINAVFAFAENVGGKDYLYISTVGTADGTAVGAKAINFTEGGVSTAVKDIKGGYAGAGWYAETIPEPTTGLLVLLGVAGLALRRRRA